MTVDDIRKQYPQYSDLSDQQLVDGLHKKFYSDIPQDQFYQKVGFTTPEQQQKNISFWDGLNIPKGKPVALNENTGQAVYQPAKAKYSIPDNVDNIDTKSTTPTNNNSYKEQLKKAQESGSISDASDEFVPGIGFVPKGGKEIAYLGDAINHTTAVAPEVMGSGLYNLIKGKSAQQPKDIRPSTPEQIANDQKVAQSITDFFDKHTSEEVANAPVTNDIKAQIASVSRTPEEAHANLQLIKSYAERNGGTVDDFMKQTGLEIQNRTAEAGSATADGLKQFAGVNAKNADMEALAKAQQMESKGIDRDTIWKQTGWGRGADNKWRFEIDDSGVNLNTNLRKEGTDQLNTNMDQPVSHNNMYQSYPDTAKIPVTLKKNMDGFGSYSDGKIELHGGVPDDYIKSTALHEGQHAIQAKEGFAMGGSPDTNSLKRIIEDVGFRLQREGGDYQPLFDLYKKLEAKTISKEDAYDTYRRLAGEVEARNVQTRMDMTAEDRRNTAPWHTEDVPRDKQIVRFSDGNMMSVPHNSSYEEKIKDIRSFFAKNVKKDKLTPDEKELYDFAMTSKSSTQFIRNGVRTLLNKGDDKMGFKHIIMRHYGEGADSELSAWDVLRIGKTIKEGSPLTDAEILRNQDILGSSKDAIRRMVKTKDGENMYIVGVGRDKTGNNAVITYYKTAVDGAERKLSTMDGNPKSPVRIQDENLVGGGSDHRGTPTVDIESINPSTLKQSEQTTSGEAKGLVRFGLKDNEAHTVIQIFKGGDVSTLPHELAHVFRRYLNDSELAEATRIFAKNGVWDIDAEEAFAEGFIKWISTGKSPTPELKSVFAQFKTWLTDLWKTVVANERDFKLTQDHKDFYRAMMGDKKAAKKIFGEAKADAKATGAPSVLMQTSREKIKQDISVARSAMQKIGEAMPAVKEWAHNNLTMNKAYEGLVQDRVAGSSKDMLHAEILHNALKELSPEANKLLQQYIVKDISDLPAQYQFLKPLGDRVVKRINDMSDELVSLGRLDEKTAKEYEDGYLKRLYDKHWFGEKEQPSYSSKKLPKTYERGVQLSTDDTEKAHEYLTKYGINQGLKPLSTANSNMIELLKDASSKGYFSKQKNGGRVILKRDGTKWSFDRDYTKAEREKMGEIENASLTIPNTMARLSAEIQQARMFERASSDARITYSGKVLDDDKMKELGYVKITDSKRYGQLANKWVEYTAAHDIIDFEEKGKIAQVWSQYLSAWKQSKTIYNASAHFNNFTSNLMLRVMSGDKNPFGKFGEAMDLMSKFDEFKVLEAEAIKGTISSDQKLRLARLRQDQTLKEAIDIGIMGRSQLHDILTTYNPSDPFTKNTGYLHGAAKKIEGAYNMEDMIFRLSMYIKRREAGLSPMEAMKQIEAILPDYTRPMPKFFRTLRNSGIAPFISWSYYVMPNIVKLIAKNPKRAAVVLGAPYVFSEAIMQSEGQSNADLPTDTIGRRIGYNVDNEGNIDTIKIDRIVPFFDVVSIPLSAAMSVYDAARTGEDAGGMSWEGAKGLISGVGNFISNYASGIPIQVIEAIRTGKDAYTGRPIIGGKNNQTPSDEMMNTGRWLLNTFAPVPIQLMSGYDFIKSQVTEQEDRKQFQDVVPRSTAQSALKMFPGINTMTYDPRATEKQIERDSKRNETLFGD